MGSDEMTCVCQVCECSDKVCEQDGNDANMEKAMHVVCKDVIVPVERLPLRVPKNNLCISDEPMEGISRYRADYVPLVSDNVRYERPKQTYQRPNVPMENFSEYRRTYQYKLVEPPKRVVKREERLHVDPWDGDSSYRVAFRAYSEGEIKRAKPGPAFTKHTSWEGMPEFKDTTIYADEYRAYPKVEKRHSLRPKHESNFALPLGAKFCANSTQREQYSKKIGKRRKLIKQPGNPDVFRPRLSEGPFPISNMKKDYVNHHLVKRVCPFVPEKIVVHSEEPLDKVTTYTHEYWQRKPEESFPQPEWSKQKPYKNPSQPFVQDTTYTKDFRYDLCFPPSQVVSLKPTLIPLQFGDNDVIQKETTYKTDYKQPPSGDYKGCNYSDRNKYEAPERSFQNISVTKDDYKGFQYPQIKDKRKMYPVELQMRYKDKKMSGRTEYKDYYGVTYRYLPAVKVPSRNYTARCNDKTPTPKVKDCNSHDDQVVSYIDSSSDLF